MADGWEGARSGGGGGDQQHDFYQATRLRRMLCYCQATPTLHFLTAILRGFHIHDIYKDSVHQTTCGTSTMQHTLVPHRKTSRHVENNAIFAISSGPELRSYCGNFYTRLCSSKTINEINRRIAAKPALATPSHAMT